MEYYFISVDRSRSNDLIIFWGPDAGGYTFNVNNAGRYTEEQVKSRWHREIENGTILAVPVSDVEGKTFPVVPRSVFLQQLQYNWGKTDPTIVRKR